MTTSRMSQIGYWKTMQAIKRAEEFKRLQDAIGVLAALDNQQKE